jgi:hypothetical protein
MAASSARLAAARAQPAQRERESSDLGLAYCVSLVGVARRTATNEGGQYDCGEAGAGRLAVGVVTGQQQGAESVGLCGVK